MRAPAPRNLPIRTGAHEYHLHFKPLSLNPANGSLRVSWDVLVLRNYTLEGSTNLVHPQWFPITSFQHLGASPSVFTQQVAVGSSRLSLRLFGAPAH